jgi:NAD(P)-dependent dehydrogenase (short-subunit alcohol dehydrogenase family)
MTLLAGKRVVVTGAGGSLGAAVVAAARAQGARVIGLVHRGGDVDAIVVSDLADEAAAQTGLAEAVRRLGGLDGLVNVAGGFEFAKVGDSPAGRWEEMFRKNLLSAVCASKAALAHLGAGGAIVNIAAAGGLKAEAGMGPYAASKSGVMRLTEALSAEQRDRGVRVNAILPTIMDTPANRAEMPKADTSNWVTVEAVADLAVFLLSDLSRAASGGHILAGG